MRFNKKKSRTPADGRVKGRNGASHSGALRRLAPPGDENGPILPVPVEFCRAAGYTPEGEFEHTAVPLSEYFWIVRRQWWKILAFVIFAVAATAIVSKRLTPVYESTATIDIDRQTPPGVIGQEAQPNTNTDADQFLATQIRLIQSDSVLRPVVDQHRLREVEKDSFDDETTPTAVADPPLQLKRLKVIRPANTYLLLISYRSTDARLAADVANAVARSYLEHTYNIRIRSSASLSSFMEKQLDELKAKMERSSAALAQFEKELNVINPEEKTNILSARLLQLNTEYTNAQTDRVRKEAAYKSITEGTLEAAQVSTQGEALKNLTERLDEAQRKFADVKTSFGANHPEYKKATAQLAEIERLLQQARENIGRRVAVEYSQAANREAMLKKAVAETKAEFDRLNSRSFEYQSLQREAEADKRLYEELVRKIREAGINAGFQSSSIRIADLARTAAKPVFPKMKLNLILAFLFASLLSVGGVVMADALNNTVRDPEQVSRMLKSEVIGSLPVVKGWKGRFISAPGNHPRDALVAIHEGDEPALTGFDEAIRTLRNSIMLSDFDRRLRSLMITSAGPSEGKSTIAAHLAAAHAQHGRKTLLIDGDLRRPSQHRCFNLSSEIGLSTVLNSRMPWPEAVQQVGTIPNLDVLLSGPPSRRAADLVGSRLNDILEDAADQYDLIIVDSPPVLGFPEPLIMAATVDGVLVVGLAGQTHRKALASTLGTLTRLRANVIGVVLNSMRADAGNGYYYRYQYHYSKRYRHYSAG